MFIVFAVWAVFGFSYPSDPVPFLLNIVSKILGFTTTAALFVRQDRRRVDTQTFARPIPAAAGR
jgi:hypothetical protein